MKSAFEKYVEEHFVELDKYSKTIAKVHGGNHPELLEVRELFLAMQEKVQQKAKQALFEPEINRLRVITNDYQVPADGCQAYQKTYDLFEALDEAYKN